MKITYEAIWEWVFSNYDLQNYFSVESLLFDVRNQFERDGRPLPEEAEPLIRNRFQYGDVYREMQAREDEKKQIAEMIGSGKVIESLSDEIIDDLQSSKSEIMDIDMTEYATKKETVIPPDIEKFQRKGRFFGSLVNRFRGFFRRK